MTVYKTEIPPAYGLLHMRISVAYATEIKPAPPVHPPKQIFLCSILITHSKYNGFSDNYSVSFRPECRTVFPNTSNLNSKCEIYNVHVARNN